MKKIKILIILIFLSSGLFSQLNPHLSTPFNSLHERYWYYRTRLTNDFLMVGLGEGQSIPMAERNLFPGSCNGFQAGEGQWGDPLTLLAPYIGVLATEHFLLNQNHQSTDKVDFELFCALNALNRLDFFAEGHYVGGVNQLNGFMLQDDVKEDFLVKNYAHFNHFNNSSDPSTGNAIDANNQLILHGDNSAEPKHWKDPINSDRGFCTNSGAVYQLTNGSGSGSDFIQFFRDPTGSVINLDSYIALLYALRLVSKYVVSNNTFNWSPFENSNNSLAQEATNIATRIQAYFRGDNWDLKDAALGTYHTGGHGGDAWVYSYPLSEGFCNLKGFHNGSDGDVVLTNQLSLPFSCQNADPTLDPAIIPNTPLWEVSHKSAQFTNDDAEFNMDLLASCDCGWDPAANNWLTQGCDDVTSGLCGLILGFFPNLNNGCSDAVQWVCSSVNQFTIIKQNYSYEDMNYNIDWGCYHSPLLYEALNGRPTTNASLSLRNQWVTTAETIIGTAPCTGPSKTPTCNGGAYFSSVDLINHSGQAPNAVTKDPNPQDAGNYPGIDYMLYYNLLKIVNPNGVTNGTYFDLSDRIISGSIGCPTGNPCTVGAFETINFNSNPGGVQTPIIVNSGSQITFRAGKSTNAGGNPMPNFFTNVHFGGPPGSWTGSIDIKIDPYSCNSQNQYERVVDSLNGGGDYGDIASNTPTHFIQYENATPSKVYVLDNNNSNTQNNSSNNNAESLNRKIDKFFVFPNPNSGNFNLNIHLSSNESFSYELTDILGRSIIGEKNIKSTETNLTKLINLSNETEGIYYLKIITSNGFIGVKNIIIQ